MIEIRRSGQLRPRVAVRSRAHATKIRRWPRHIGHLQTSGVPGRNEPNVGEINYEYLFKLVDELKYDGIGCEYRPVLTTTAGLG